MIIEDKIPDYYKRYSFHPSYFTYAWRKRNLEKLFEELMKSNIAILECEAWIVEKDRIQTLIPLKNGEIKVYSSKLKRKTDEEWFDFVEKSVKETLKEIDFWNLEKTGRVDLVPKIYYHFKFSELSEEF